MFGRATITLGIGPHSSCCLLYSAVYTAAFTAVYTAVCGPSTRPCIRCTRPCSRPLWPRTRALYIHGHVHSRLHDPYSAVFTAGTRPRNGRLPAVYTGPCTRSVYTAVTAVFTDRTRPCSQPVRPCTRAVYTHGHVHADMAVYAARTRPCTRLCSRHVLVAVYGVYTAVYMVPVHGPCTRPVHGRVHERIHGRMAVYKGRIDARPCTRPSTPGVHGPYTAV